MNNKTIEIHCNKCNHNTNHIIVVQKSERDNFIERIGGHLMDLWEDTIVQVLKCGSCSEYTLRTFTQFCDDAPDFPEKNERIIPKRGKSSIPLPGAFQNVPPLIVEIYRETIEAFLNELNVLCAGGIRTIIEAICEYYEIKGGQTPNGYSEKLEGQIYGMYEMELITKHHSDILHQHRYLGNKALHKLEAPSLEELQLAIEILAHTLIAIYDLKHKGEELEKKKNIRKGKI